MKKIQLLGATGSIGKQTIDIIETYPESFQLTAISARNNIKDILHILSRHDVQDVAMLEEYRDVILTQFPKVNFYALPEGLVEISTRDREAVVVNALVGRVGLEPTLKAIEANKDVLLANKETLVIGGTLIKEALKTSQSTLHPIDSEHAALKECLRGSSLEDVEKVVITASGGSLRDIEKEALDTVTISDVLKHPNWSMGAKITVDSATMMNKVFEVIEAHYLFDLPYDKIEAIMHRESIVHGLVSFQDGNTIVHMGPSDMRIPILGALSPKKRLRYPTLFDLTQLKTLQFEPINLTRFSLFDLGIAVAKRGGMHVVTLNAANEEAVMRFLNNEISFVAIESFIIEALNHFDNTYDLSLEAIIMHDQNVREYIRGLKD